jgi:hypothetical protein
MNLVLLLTLAVMCSAYITIVERIPTLPAPLCRFTGGQFHNQRDWSCTNHSDFPLPTDTVQICSNLSGLLSFTVRNDFTAKTIRIGCPTQSSSRVQITLGNHSSLTSDGSTMTADTIMIEFGSTLLLTNGAVLRANVVSVGVLGGSGVIQGQSNSFDSPVGSVTIATRGFLVPGGDGIGTLSVTGDVLLDYNSVLGMRWVDVDSHDILVVNGELMFACKYCWWLEGDVSQNITQSDVVQTGSLTCTLSAPLGLPLGAMAFLQRVESTTPKPGGGNSNSGALSLTGGEGKTSLGTASLAGTSSESLGSTSSGTLVASTSTPDTCSGSIYESLFDPCSSTGPVITRTCRCVNGACDGLGVCQCDAGYIGAYCDTLDCPGHPICADHGSCTLGAQGLPFCLCAAGWGGPECAVPVCPAVAGGAPCSEVGTCYPFDPPVCACPFGYSGAACEVNEGFCVDCQHGTCSNATCLCEAGWTGVSCQLPDCPGTPDCSARGQCSNGQCLCDPGFSGPDCATPICPGDSQGAACSGRGRCLVTDTAPVCVCDTGFTGADCSARMTTCDASTCINGACPVAAAPLSVTNCGNTQSAEVFSQHMAGLWSSAAGVLSQTAPATTSSHCFLEFGSAALLGGFPGGNSTLTVRATFNFTNPDAIQGLTITQDPDNYWQLLLHPTSRTARVQSLSFGVLHSYGIRILPQNVNVISLEVDPSPSYPGYHKISLTPRVLGVPGAEISFVVPLPAGQVGLYAFGEAQASQLCLTGLTTPPQPLVAPDSRCACQPYYLGSACAVLDCSALSYCNSRGTCALASDGLPVCTCEAGWGGPDCKVPACPSDCSGHGFCRIATAAEPVCDCDPSWNTAADCSVLAPKCPDSCSIHGQCLWNAVLGAAYCNCSSDWTGPLCDIPVCNGITTSECSGLGVCVATSSPHVCQCSNAAVSGANCEYQDLSVLCPDNCNSGLNQGTCDFSNQLAQCSCSPGYEGTACEKAANAWTTTILANEVATTIAGASRFVVYGGAAGAAALVIIVVAVIGAVVFRKRKAELNIRLQSMGTGSSAPTQRSVIEETPTENSWASNQSFRTYAVDDEELNFV